jgi:phage antirepressor YoqD-like protein
MTRETIEEMKVRFADDLIKRPGLGEITQWD